MNSNKPEISLISPCLNEEENIINFIDSVNSYLKPITNNYEIIIVDDGSTDNTWKYILDLKKKYSEKLKAIKFTRNFGHQRALICGIRKASGKKIITMDSDLEHPPSLIPELHNTLVEGNFDIVSCSRKTKFLSFKYFFSNIFYFLFNLISKNKIKKNVSDFKIFTSDVQNNLNFINEKNIFLRGMMPWLGYKEKVITYNLLRRTKGKSKLGLKKQLSFSIDGFFNFSYFPRRFAFFISFIFFILSIISFIYFLYKILLTGINLLLINISSIFFILFLLFFVLGIISEYLARILEQTQNRPDYVITEEI